VNRVAVQPHMLSWARDRSGLTTEALQKRFPRLREWERGQRNPTLKQLEQYARATHTPVGYLFLTEPPVEQVPIPDLRTVGGQQLPQPSPHLLDTIYVCQQRQDWFREFARLTHCEPVAMVGSAQLSSDPMAMAAHIRATLDLYLDEQRQARTWTDALRSFIGHADEAGILVMCSGVVGNNTHRKLDPAEFRGFALADALAPLVFINGADRKAAQMFTLAHELAHIWLGQSALSDVAVDDSLYPGGVGVAPGARGADGKGARGAGWGKVGGARDGV
jgi:transcriptional regulator with XRE-family HTH domain